MIDQFDLEIQSAAEMLILVNCKQSARLRKTPDNRIFWDDYRKLKI